MSRHRAGSKTALLHEILYLKGRNEYWSNKFHEAIKPPEERSEVTPNQENIMPKSITTVHGDMIMSERYVYRDYPITARALEEAVLSGVLKPISSTSGQRFFWVREVDALVTSTAASPRP